MGFSNRKNINQLFLGTPRTMEPPIWVNHRPLASRKELDLAGTNVSGDISALFQWKQLEEVDLSGTQMSGRLGRAWRGQAPQLRILKLTNCKQLAFIPTGGALAQACGIGTHQFF